VRDEDREKKLEFLFSIYDMDRDGYISNGELFQASTVSIFRQLDSRTTLYYSVFPPSPHSGLGSRWPKKI